MGASEGAEVVGRSRGRERLELPVALEPSGRERSIASAEGLGEGVGLCFIFDGCCSVTHKVRKVAGTRREIEKGSARLLGGVSAGTGGRPICLGRGERTCVSVCVGGGRDQLG